jgi:hypothetical protein
VIMRILGEGQYDVPDAYVGRLGELDAVLRSAAASGDDEECVVGLQAPLEAVRDLGTPLPDAVPTPLDAMLPDEGTSRRHMHEMQALMAVEGVIPG